jgi:mono/diheme cytochrome c family protein
MRFKPLRLLGLLFVILLAACGTQPTPQPTQVPSTSIPSPTAAQVVELTVTPAQPPASGGLGLPLPTDRDDLFAASGVCATCHTQLVDGAGNDVSMDSAWRSSMMANAARDPYWQASVRAEALRNPSYRAIIEDKCATCHTAMARFSQAAAGGQGILLDDGYLDPGHASHNLAIDGVSCTVCHQVQPDGLGEEDSFSGGFVISTDLPPDQRVAFGQFTVAMGMARTMQTSSGFVPVQGLHVEEAELCATCHTLYTPFLDASDQIAGEFPEQVAYLEWEASSLSQTLSCQGCHMPTAEGSVSLSSQGARRPRSPFYQHTFVGGNAYMLSVLRTFGAELAVTASDAQFQDKATRTLEQLEGHTASLALEGLDVSDSALTADVVVQSKAGHKFPTGFPARRVWIHFMVQDAGGAVVFESGAVSDDGSISGNDNDADAGSFEPHYLVIDDPGQVQIYEAIMGDTEGQPTTTLLRGAGYLKDNRLLPAGFDKTIVEADIAVHGAAVDDGDFLGGSDTVRYLVALNGAEGPFTVTAELLYQSIGFRWADNLRRHDALETARFLSYYEQVPNRPALVVSATVEVE